MPRLLPPRRYVNWWGFRYDNNGDSFAKTLCFKERRDECLSVNFCIFCRNRKRRESQHPNALRVRIDEKWALDNCKMRKIIRQDIYMVKYLHGNPVDAEETTLRASGDAGDAVGEDLSQKVRRFVDKRVEEGWRLVPKWDYLEIEEKVVRRPFGVLNPKGTDYVADLINKINPIVRSPKYANGSNTRFENHQIFRTLLNWHNITPDQFARKWGKKPSFIHALLSGKKKIEREARLLMYDAFGIPPDYWLNDEPLW